MSSVAEALTVGFQVEFDIAQVKSNKKHIAVNIRVKERAERTSDSQVQQNGKGHRDVPTHQGFIAALKDGFGFIENITHDKEVFFHFRWVGFTPLLFRIVSERPHTLEGAIHMPTESADLLDGDPSSCFTLTPTESLLI